MTRGRAAAALAAAAVLTVLGPGAADAGPTMRYGADTQQVLDAYPASSPGSPVVVVVHGGGWTGGDKAGPVIVRVARALQADGYAVFSINYRLASATQDGVPEQADDVASAVRWVFGHAAGYGGDRSDISLVGGSAGGQLVSLAGQQIAARFPRLVDRVAAFSGPMDFTQDPVERVKSAAPLYLGCVVCTQAELRGPSPIYNITGASPPFWIANSEAEIVPLGQATSMDAALTEAGVASTLVVVPGSTHGFALFDRLHARLLTFLRS